MQRLDLLVRRLVHPAQRLASSQQELAYLASRLAAAARHRMQRHASEVVDLRWRLDRGRPDIGRLRSRLDGLATAVAALSPQATLARGYAVVRDDTGSVVRDSAQLRLNSQLSLRFAKGGGDAVVTRIIPD